jgi:hypothetical protein
MTHDDAPIMHRCVLCKYQTKRKFDLKRHHNAIHMLKIPENIGNINSGENVIPSGENVIPSGENVIPSGENVIPGGENVIPGGENVISNTFICKICNKSYKTKKYLIKHEQNCKKVDILTCPRCMVSFANRHNKNRHIKADKCKSRSIIHARTPNVQNNFTVNGDNFQNAETIQNINNIYVNNFGSERIDHITEEDLKRILQSGINTVPLYIEKKHFDSNFPENKNIKYTNDNKCQVMEGNSWKEKDIGLLSNNLIKNNSEVLLMYCDNNEVKLMNEIKDEDIYDHIRNKLLIIYNKSDDQKYNNIMLKIKDIIKNSRES